MPCWTERTVTLDLKVADEGVLVRALKATGLAIHAGLSPQMLARRIVETGTITFINVEEDRAQELAARVKVAYANEAVRTAAKRFGWTTAKSTVVQGAVELTRKSF